MNKENHLFRCQSRQLDIKAIARTHEEAALLALEDGEWQNLLMDRFMLVSDLTLKGEPEIFQMPKPR